MGSYELQARKRKERKRRLPVKPARSQPLIQLANDIPSIPFRRKSEKRMWGGRITLAFPKQSTKERESLSQGCWTGSILFIGRREIRWGDGGAGALEGEEKNRALKRIGNVREEFTLRVEVLSKPFMDRNRWKAGARGGKSYFG